MLFTRYSRPICTLALFFLGLLPCAFAQSIPVEASPDAPNPDAANKKRIDIPAASQTPNTLTPDNPSLPPLNPANKNQNRNTTESILFAPNQDDPTKFLQPKPDLTGPAPLPQSEIPSAETPEFTKFLEERLSLRSLPVTASIPEKIVIQAMMRLLIQREILPQAVYNLYSRNINALVSRGAFANVLIKSQGHNTSLVSEYPTYRDVPKTYWAYAPIEVARERQLLTGNAQGYFHPNDIVSRKDAYLIFAGLLAGTRPSLALSDKILSPFSDSGSIPERIRPDIARLVNAQLILPKPEPDNQLNIEAPLDFAELSAILSREVEIQDYKRFLLPVNEATLPHLPSGVAFSVVPNGALFKNKMVVGDTVYFSLTQPVQTTLNGAPLEIPLGTRLDGELANITNGTEGPIYEIHFNKIQVPAGDNYQVEGSIDLKFDNTQVEPFIVPGEPYHFTSTYTQP
ncbi:MAG: S-layer homology domain-containing protein [Vampirovibrionales bacterium]|nr:S-layer homology domain-containing protein [Vampirovibrionales bacterium]